MDETGRESGRDWERWGCVRVLRGDGHDSFSRVFLGRKRGGRGRRRSERRARLETRFTTCLPYSRVTQHDKQSSAPYCSVPPTPVNSASPSSPPPPPPHFRFHRSPSSPTARMPQLIELHIDTTATQDVYVSPSIVPLNANPGDLVQIRPKLDSRSKGKGKDKPLLFKVEKPIEPEQQDLTAGPSGGGAGVGGVKDAAAAALAQRRRQKPMVTVSPTVALSFGWVKNRIEVELTLVRSFSFSRQTVEIRGDCERSEPETTRRSSCGSNE